MFIVLLKFSTDKSKAPKLMAGHNEWIKRGFDDGIFLLVGSLKPGLGGAVFARDVSREELERRVALDPFVIENIVTAEILEIEPAKTIQQLEFLVRG